MGNVKQVGGQAVIEGVMMRTQSSLRAVFDHSLNLLVQIFSHVFDDIVVVCRRRRRCFRSAIRHVAKVARDVFDHYRSQRPAKENGRE